MTSPAEQERAAVVAWLRAGGRYKPCHIGPATRAEYGRLADIIEAGEHLRGGE